MATIISVHGTFAHSTDWPGDSVDASRKSFWWQRNSDFEQHIRHLVSGEDGEVSFRSFEWSGENSESERRKSGSKLLALFQELEARQEPYCVIGHSHGGSVIASALVESVVRGIELDHLRRWVSVGTPFVELRKERFLFLRLPLIMKAIFIASLMLLFMFAFFVIGEFAVGSSMFHHSSGVSRLLISAVLMSLPFVLFYVFANYLDSRKLWHYERDIIEKARQKFSSKWLSLCHEDDEAVQGLSSLSSVKLNIFERSFAVPGLSLASVFILPLLYLYLIFSPTLMTGLASYLANNVYGISEFQKVEETYKTKRLEIKGLREKIKKINEQIRSTTLDTSRKIDLRGQRDRLKNKLREARKQMRLEHPNMTQTFRAARFKKRFLEIDGRACPGNRLCYGGRDVVLNSGLLFHLVTDESTSWFVDEEVRTSVFGKFFQYVFPIIMVPFVFGLLAVGMVLLVQFLAGFVSYAISFVLDDLTWSEVRRSALGNDTETEVAVSARRNPSWIGAPRPFLPHEVSAKITDYSNQAMTASLGKIRGAISDLAFSDGNENKTATVLAYLNWHELIHMAYFEVPEFRTLVALSISELDGFKPKQVLIEGPFRPTVENWLNTLRA